ncbi:MAG: LamG-like jellyroll fold domain-containing protein [Acidobacteriota bacterium]
MKIAPARPAPSIPRRPAAVAATFAAAALVALTSTPAAAVAPPLDIDNDPTTQSTALIAEPTLEWLDADAPELRAYPGLASFLDENGEQWEIVLDRRSNRPHLLQGSGAPLIPGAGNGLSSRELGLRGEVQATDVERQLRALLDRHPGLLAESLDEFTLDAQRSFQIGDHWSLELRQHHRGVPVENARLVARLTAGNLTQLGAVRVAPVGIATEPNLSADDAFAAALAELELAPASASAKLGLIATVDADEIPGVPYAGEPGAGWQHRLVWTWSFLPKRADGSAIGNNTLANWLLRVDAHSGEILEFVDETRYADVTADVVPTEPLDPLVSVGVPHMEVGLQGSGTVFTDSTGWYNYPGGNVLASGRLFGRYVKTYDTCNGGSNIWIGSGSPGDLDFGGVPNPAGSCDAPANTAGPGNTNAARSAYVHASHQSHEARCRFNGCTGLAPFPDLAQPFDIYTNVFLLACNGAWLPNSNDMAVGPEAPGLCNNTGTNRAVVIHEWGHAFDDFTLGVAPERGSGEAFADTFAFVETGDGCIGRGFYVNNSCPNCDPACTGVRDLPTFSLGGPRPIARPSNIERTDGLNCAPTIYDPQTGNDYIECPVSYRGPMGYQGHCESHIASTANWDLRESLKTRWGAAPGEVLFEDLWWETSVPARSAYRIAAGGQCNPEAAIDGCGLDNWYRVLLQMDDDNGNLADGTPNACRIYDAYAAHGIACGARPACTADAACTPPPSQLAAWYPLDGFTGNSTAELMASNRAVLNGNPQPVAGQVGIGLSFDGDDHLEAQDCQHADVGTGDFTILAWVRTTQQSGTVVSKRDRVAGRYRGYLLQFFGGRPLLQLADPSAPGVGWSNFQMAGPDRIDDGQWHLVAATVDRSSATGARLSIDAGPQQTFDPTSRSGDLSNLAGLRIGRGNGDANGNDYGLTGDLDEVQIYKRALGQAEIQAIWNAGPSGVCTSPLPALLSCTGTGMN